MYYLTASEGYQIIVAKIRVRQKKKNDFKV